MQKDSEALHERLPQFGAGIRSLATLLLSPSDGSRAVRALSWALVDRILDDLEALKVCDPNIVTGSSFKLEKENFDEKDQRRQLWICVSREKSYALYARDANGVPILAKHSAHTIGLYSSPYGREDRERRWIAEAWAYAIRKALGEPVEETAWFGLPAISQLTLTTANLMQHYKKTSHPFDFLAVAQLAYKRMLRCCEAPRPSCPLFADLAQWSEQPWRCLSCGAPVDPCIADTDEPIFKTYRRVVADLASTVEIKRLLANGAEPTRETMLGLTIPRPVHVKTIHHMGKEVIADPTDTAEGFTAEQLYATDPVVYQNKSEGLEALRAQIRMIGVNVVARETSVSRSAVQAFVNRGATLQSATLAKIEAFFERL